MKISILQQIFYNFQYDEELTEYEDEECELYESDIGLDSEGRDDEDDDRSEELKSIVEDRLTVDVSHTVGVWSWRQIKNWKQTNYCVFSPSNNFPELDNFVKIVKRFFASFL